MNHAGTFGTEFSIDAPVSLTDHHIKIDSADASATSVPLAHDTILVPDAQLLFAGDFNRLGDDLVLSKDGHEFLVHDYFHGEKRAFLASPDGANLSGRVVEALTGHVQYAQAGDIQSTPKDIGQVSKLAGTATVIRNGVLVELHSGDRVYKGDVVQAGTNSSVTILFVDGTVFGLSADARMVLNEMVYDQAGTANSALISLVRGTISFVAGETAKHGDMKIETPVATMGIRGTAVLVEIGFDIPSDGKAPPVNFQVLVEPDGTTGSYILYSKSDPSVVIGTVNQAGQVFSVSGDGTFSNLPSPEMSQVAAGIIQQVFAQRFPGYIPPNPQSGGGAGSTPPTPPGGDVPQLHDTPGDGPAIIPITIQVPDGSGGTKPVTIPVGVGAPNTPPKISVQDVVTEANSFSFKIGDRVTISDPDIHDVAVPYVAGSAILISVVGSANPPGGHHLGDLITINPQTGAVSYDAGAFTYLAQGEQVIVTIGFESQSGPETVHETLHFIIDGLNDPPVVTGPLTATAAEGSPAFTANLLSGSSDKDHGETASLSVGNVTYKIDGGDASSTSPAGVSLSSDGHTLTVDPADPAFDHLAAGEQTTIVVSYDVTDVHGASVAQTETITITGTNDAPVAHNDSVHIYPFHTSVHNNVLTNDTDVDTAHSSLTVSSVAHATSDGMTFTVDGIYGELVVQKDGSYVYTLGATHDEAAALAHLHTGQDATDTFYYTASDGSANSNVAKLSISFDKPSDPHPPVASSDHLIISAGAFEKGPHGSTSVTFDNSVLLSNDRDGDSNKFYVDKYVSDFFAEGHAGSSSNDEDTVYTIANFQLPGKGQILHDGFSYNEIDQLGTSSNFAHVDLTVVGADSSRNPQALKSYTLNSTTNNEVLIGGDNSIENFVFKPGSVGHDTIVDFTKGQDHIDLFKFSAINENNIANYVTEADGNTLIHLDPNDTILVKGVTGLTANDFIIHPGGSGPHVS